MATKENVLVTGGAGYIGSHVALALQAAGYGVIIIDNLTTGHQSLVPPGTRFIMGDLKQTELLNKIMSEYKISAVLHLAASALLGESFRMPIEYYANNCGALCSLLQAMDLNHVRHLIFSSSASVYKNVGNRQLFENDPIIPPSPYGRTKAVAEQIIKDYADSNPNFSFVALRYFNAGGADPELRSGEWHEPETHLIPVTIKAALNITGPLHIFGTDYPTPDGTCVRDYVHVCDIAHAHLLALEHLSMGRHSAIYNLGSGVGYSVQEIIKMVEKVTDRELPVYKTERRPGDPVWLVASIQKIKQEWNWEPQNNLESIVTTAFNYEKKLSGKF